MKEQMKELDSSGDAKIANTVLSVLLNFSRDEKIAAVVLSVLLIVILIFITTFNTYASTQENNTVTGTPAVETVSVYNADPDELKAILNERIENLQKDNKEIIGISFATSREIWITYNNAKN